MRQKQRGQLKLGRVVKVGWHFLKLGVLEMKDCVRPVGQHLLLEELLAVDFRVLRSVLLSEVHGGVCCGVRHFFVWRIFWRMQELCLQQHPQLLILERSGI